MKAERTHWTSAAVVALAVTCAAGALTRTGSLLVGGREAHAIVGRPLTPMSYAGVARRTTRRTVYAGAAAGAYYGHPYAAPVAPVGVVTTLPAGCAQVMTGGAVVYNCGSVRYQPYYDGPTVVYRPL